MPAVPYNSLMLHLAAGAINFATGTFKAMLVSDDYVVDVDGDAFRDDVTGEIVGAGYAAGGIEVDATVTLDNANNRVAVTFASATLEAVTFTDAAAVVLYHARGGDPDDDELVAYSPFNVPKNSSGGDFIITFANPLYLAAAA